MSLANKLPKLSFEVDAPIDLELPEDIQAARDAILDQSTELKELLLGPRQTVVEYQYNYHVCLHALYHWKIPEAPPVEEEATYAELAERCHLNEPDLRHLVRHAISNRIFKEVRKGVVAHTAISKLMAEDPLLQDYIGVGSEKVWGATVETIPAMAKWPNSQEPAKTGFSKYNNTNEPMYEFISKRPDRAKRLMGTMAMSLSGPAYKLDHIVNNGPWAKLPEGALIVDVGGSHGDAMIAIAKKFSHLRFVVQDLPSTIEAHPTLKEGLVDRVEFMPYDFFTPQSVCHADVYFFRWIFHNWPDKYCLLILQNLILALKHRARVVINEWILPEPNCVSNRVERQMRAMDISMLTLFNSQERDRDDWISLFKRADERFQFVDITHPKGANLSIIEFVW